MNTNQANTAEDDRILTQHPAGKSGKRIDRKRYELVRVAILRALKAYGELTHSELTLAARHILPSDFPGSAQWYIETVKLDLEAKNLIERTGDRPAKYRLAKGEP